MTAMVSRSSTTARLDLIGPTIQLFHDQALFKPAHTGGPIHWHQDNGYWQCEP